MKEKEFEVCKISLDGCFEKIKHFCQLVTNFESNIYLCSEDYAINAKSIMGVHSLDTTKELTLTVDRPNEIDDLYKLVHKYGYAI